VSTESKDTEDVEDVGNTEDVAESTEPVTAVSGTIMQAATALDDVITKLAETSLSSLVGTSAARSEMMLQHGISHLISPIKKSPDPTIADLIPTTRNEVRLLAALREAEMANTMLKERLIHSQAANILNEMYCAKLRGQLADQQEKKKNGQRRKVLGDSLPCLLSGDAFYQQVFQHDGAQKRPVDDKTARANEYS
jgi:hypothetical protein